MQAKLMYITDDGTVFETEEMAKAHERELFLREALASLWFDIQQNDRLTEDDRGNRVIMSAIDFANVIMWREKEILAILQGIE